MGQCAYEERTGVLAARWNVSTTLQTYLLMMITDKSCRMLAIACVLLTVIHPAYFFPPFAAFRRHNK
jgi:hypothetical protein